MQHNSQKVFYYNSRINAVKTNRHIMPTILGYGIVQSFSNFTITQTIKSSKKGVYFRERLRRFLIFFHQKKRVKHSNFFLQFVNNQHIMVIFFVRKRLRKILTLSKFYKLIWHQNQIFFLLC